MRFAEKRKAHDIFKNRNYKPKKGSTLSRRFRLFIAWCDESCIFHPEWVVCAKDEIRQKRLDMEQE